MGIPLYQVDAFTSEPFRGNPAAVCLLPAERDAAWMQKVAAEMNLSETAFLVKQQDGFSLRWFTPKVEVDLCGHATLASAHVLYQCGILKCSQEARFHTRSGLLTAKPVGEWIELNFPAKPVEPLEAPNELLRGLKLSEPPRFIGLNKMDYLVEVNREEIVRNLQPDFTLLARVRARAVIVTSAAKGEYHFISRFFAPAVGINEDPVTGSAHCALGPYWQQRLNSNEFLAYQASSRGGVLKVRVEGDRVHMAGQAVTILKGELI